MEVSNSLMMPVLEKTLEYDSGIKYLESDASFPFSI